MLIFQVTRAAVEQYTGEGEPPRCEMTLRAADGSTPPNLTLPVTLTGVKPPTTITMERVAETSDGVVRLPVTPLAKSPGQFLSHCELFYENYYSDSAKLVCQVFYHKKGNNCWKATFAFYPEDKAEVSHLTMNNNESCILFMRAESL